MLGLLGLLGLLGCERPESSPEKTVGARAGVRQRLVTLTPSVTEIVLSLGARDRLVAVDRFSRESRDLARLADIGDLPIAGDFVAPNVEVIARLRPHIIILDEAQAKAEASLRGAGYRTLMIRMHSTKDVRKAVLDISKALGVIERGRKLVATIDKAIAAAKKQQAQFTKRPKVLWVIDRQPGELSNVIAAGPGSYADELVRLVGGENALTDKAVRYPKLSREALARLPVDLIIDSSGAAQDSFEAWTKNEHDMVAAMATSAATPRPDIESSLKRVGELVLGAANQTATR